MNTSRRQQCQGKVRHKTYRGALIALRAHGAALGDLTLTVYACRHCNGFHLGHPPKSERNRLRFNRLLKLIDRANEK